MSRKFGLEVNPDGVNPTLILDKDAIGLEEIMDQLKPMEHFDQKWQSKNDL